jgi:hypothetical protein
VAAFVDSLKEFKIEQKVSIVKEVKKDEDLHLYLPDLINYL